VFEQAMRMFSPFPDDGAAPGPGAEKARGETQAEQIESLREQVELLRRQLDELTGEKKDGPRRS